MLESLKKKFNSPYYLEKYFVERRVVKAHLRRHITNKCMQLYILFKCTIKISFT